MGEFDEPGVGVRKLSLLSAAASLAGAFTVSLVASPAGGQTAPPSSQVELEQEIRKRDAIITDLLRRVEALERGTGAPAPAQAVAARAVQAPPPPGPAPVAGATPVQSAQAAPAPQAGAAPVQAAPASAAPGQFEVDEAAAERALERTLVRTGALLLPVGAVEIEPGFQYSRLETDAPIVVVQNGQQLVGLQRLERDLSEFSLAARVGLPWDAQLEVSLPYRFEDQSRIVSVEFTDLQEIENDGDGFGDVGVALSKVLMREDGYWPDLIGAVAWDTTTGADGGDFRFGSDFDELSLSLTAVKRADPLVWVGTLSWQDTFKEDGVEPGDQWRLVLGGVLAVNPTTSLRFNLDQAFIDDTELRGVKVPGSDTVASTLVFGASTVLSRRLLLDVQAGVGLTDAAPDYYVNVAFPIRFDSLF